MVTKKRSETEGQTSGSAKRTTKRTSSERSEGKEPRRAVERAVSAASKKVARPKLRASHAEGARSGAGANRRTTIGRAKGPSTTTTRGPAVRKAPLATPKRTQPRKAPPETPSAARSLALDIVAAGLEKKALNCEIIDVRGRVDYTDFLVIMTGRSDRHVSSIAQGIEEELGKKKVAPISTEGMTASTWVLMDYADVVVHVFQEDARQLYDIEGLWMDASRVNVPDDPDAPARAQTPVSRDDDDDDLPDDDDVTDDE
ncbi:MAG TPA: ribosome silencing factor [Polyangium sp.]|nr:ribosome silencing factor [Polyangium sp.]